MRAGRYPDDHPLERQARHAQYRRAIANVQPKAKPEPKQQQPEPKPKPARTRW